MVRAPFRTVKRARLYRQTTELAQAAECVKSFLQGTQKFLEIALPIRDIFTRTLETFRVDTRHNVAHRRLFPQGTKF
jgi:hypothetical protein